MYLKNKIPKAAKYIQAFEKMAFGMFVHWGLYSDLGRGEWLMHMEKMSVEDYSRLIERFDASNFNAHDWTVLAKESGMRYIVLTTRHHDGFSLYDTKGLSEFDVINSPAGRDLVEEFVQACRREDITPFFYHTTLDWRFDTINCDDEKFEEYLDYFHASVELLCKNYGAIGGIWFDGDWSRPMADWKHDRLYSMIRKLQPDALIINNTGVRNRGAILHTEIDSVTYEQGLPKPIDRRGATKYIASEMCQTINSHWGNAINDFSSKSPEELIKTLAASRKVGSNYLLNIGPAGGGSVNDFDSAILRKIGKWISLHGVAIYEGIPTDVECQGQDFLLQVGNRYYYFVHDLGISGDENVTIGLSGSGPRGLKNFHTPIKEIHWTDNSESLAFTQNTDSGLVAIDLTDFPYGINTVIRVAEIIC